MRMSKNSIEKLKNEYSDIEYKKDINMLCRCWLKILDKDDKSNTPPTEIQYDAKDLEILNLKKHIYDIMKNKGSGLSSEDTAALNVLKNEILDLNSKISSEAKELKNSAQLLKLKTELNKSDTAMNSCKLKLEHYNLWFNNISIFQNEILKIKELPCNMRDLILKFLDEIKKMCSSSIKCYTVAFRRWKCSKELLEVKLYSLKNKEILNPQYRALEKNMHSFIKLLRSTYEAHKTLATKVNSCISDISYDYSKMMDDLNSWTYLRLKNAKTNIQNTLPYKKENMDAIYDELYSLKLSRINLDHSLIEFVLNFIDSDTNEKLLNMSINFLDEYLKKVTEYEIGLNKLKNSFE